MALSDGSLRIGFLSAAHMHVGGYAAALRGQPRARIVGVWDDVPPRGQAFADAQGVPFVAERERLIEMSDAVVVGSENRKHVENALAALAQDRPVLCEKPLVTTDEEAQALHEAARGKTFMTAFPCRFSPVWPATKRRAEAIGPIRAIVATNRGTCPGGWFVEPALAGGGAMIDHVVHVADLLGDLLGRAPERVYAQTGARMYGRDTDDCALVSLDYPGGPFVTLDSSWSRPLGFRTWGDLTMRLVGDAGTVEMDLLGPVVHLTKANGYTETAFGSDADAALVRGFVEACLDGAPVLTTLEDGLAASAIAIAAYRSAGLGQPVALATR